MKILVTGGNGFIAKNLSEQLNHKYKILALGRKELDLLDSSSVFELLKKYKFDVVIHAATYDAAARFSTNDPNKVLENNLKMFFNLARCKNYFRKMLYFGSGAEFDRTHWIPKMKEEYFDTYIPKDQYGFSKYIMNKYIQSADNIYNLRLFGMYGKYDDWKTRLIPNICCQAVMNLPITMEINQYRDFLYINDLVQIVDWFIKNKPKKKDYNICSGQAYEYKSLAEKIIKISGKKLKLKIKKKGLGQEYSGDNTRLLKEIKGFNFTQIDDSLRALYNWHEKNINIIEKDKL